MCLALYIGANKEIPLIPYNERDRRLWTDKLAEEEYPIPDFFSLPIITYVGSDTICGCGFRHLGLDKEEWVVKGGEDEETYIKNHKDLLEFIKENLSDHDKIEIYTVMEGDFKTPPKYKAEIDIAELLNKDFSFKELGFYIVNLAGKI